MHICVSRQGVLYVQQKLRSDILIVHFIIYDSLNKFTRYDREKMSPHAGCYFTDRQTIIKLFVYNNIMYLTEKKIWCVFSQTEKSCIK